MLAARTGTISCGHTDAVPFPAGATRSNWSVVRTGGGGANHQAGGGPSASSACSAAAPPRRSSGSPFAASRRLPILLRFHPPTVVSADAPAPALATPPADAEHSR
jgi:hypothetical protein